MPQYWTQNDFMEKINNNLDYNNIKFYKTDTYDEDKIMETISKDDIQLQFPVTKHMVKSYIMITSMI